MREAHEKLFVKPLFKWVIQTKELLEKYNWPNTSLERTINDNDGGGFQRFFNHTCNSHFMKIKKET